MDHAQVVEIGGWVREARKIRERFREKMRSHTVEAGSLVPGPPKARVERACNGLGDRRDPGKVKPPSVVPKGKSGRPKVGRFRGVSTTRIGKFKAQLNARGTAHYLGTFATEEAAARAFDARSFELRGWSEDLNFPDEWPRTGMRSGR